ncbi:hypothetical protein SB5531_00792 [Klebsiella variicola]|uniref:DUF2158 domain-containing protein n=1 Tax=Klebsiella variicola TaxID=244366 RepID=UPI0010EA20C1|nr:DUF2158 domain-containing protein [Klebsiella variicola]VGP71015.1 hypothetical protein SB5531_00792 [Klebsiella variicola]
MNPEELLKFKQGDLVVHVAGGPKLSVLGIGHQYNSTPEKPIINVECQWWDEPSNSFKKEVFNQALLKEFDV